MDGQPVAGATGSTFTPAAADLRKQVAVQVTATRAGYSPATATSVATAGVVPATFQNTGDPSVQGTPRVGVALRALPGGWSPEPTLGYQWLAGGTPIAGATASTFTPTAAQAGKTLTVRVTARRPGYLTSVVDSPVTAAVLPGTNSVTTVPEISGRPVVGQTLTATSGTWAVPPTSVAYAWFADGKAVPGATSSKLAVTRALLDQRITVAVTATADGYAPLVATSAATTVGRARRHRLHGDADHQRDPAGGSPAHRPDRHRHALDRDRDVPVAAQRQPDHRCHRADLSPPVGRRRASPVRADHPRVTSPDPGHRAARAPASGCGRSPG